MVSQVNYDFSARNKSVVAYLKLVMDLISTFEKFELAQILRTENTHIDTLSKLASSKVSELLTIMPIEYILRPSTSKVKM